MADPAFTAAYLPLIAGPGTTFAWNASITEDLRSLVTLSARREGAKAAFLQINAQILWQEWQTAAQARLLYVQLVEGERQRALQQATMDLFAERSRRLQAALSRGDVSLTATAPDLAALQQVRAQLDTALRQQLARRHQLNALLGRMPDADLPLAGTVEVAEPDLARIDRDAVTLSQRRPDLIALRLGYRAQEAKVRLAVLDQFPVFNFGITGGSDNSNVRNGGPQVSTSLPIFDGGRADLAVQRATRAQLRAEYQARLDAAYGQIRAATGELQAAERSLSIVRGELPTSKSVKDRAERALAAGTIDELAYVDLANAYFAKALEAASLEQTIFEQRLAISALTGDGLPTIQSLPETPA